MISERERDDEAMFQELASAVSPKKERYRDAENHTQKFQHDKEESNTTRTTLDFDRDREFQRMRSHIDKHDLQDKQSSRGKFSISFVRDGNN